MSFGKRSVFGSGGGATTQGVALNMTALMDILSNLLFFLLASYAAQAVEVQEKDAMHLPSSSSQVKLELQLTVSITQHTIDVAGTPVGAIERGKLLGAVDESGKIPALFDKLKSLKEKQEASGRAQGPDKDGILLLADKDTDSDVITKVLKTAGYAGFVNVRFGVIAQ